MNAIEAKREGGTIYRILDSEGQVSGCVIRVSRTSAESLDFFLERRVQLFEINNQVGEEVELVRSLYKQIGESLERKGNNKNGKVELGLNAQDVEQFGSLLIKRGVRLPILMRAMVEITCAIGIDSSTNLSEINSYCLRVLKEVESMPH